MEIQFQSHNADVSELLRARAEAAVHRLGARVPRAVGATIRFERDGRARRVELVMHAAGRRRLVAAASADRFPSALATAVQRLDAQTRDARRPARSRPSVNVERA